MEQAFPNSQIDPSELAEFKLFKAYKMAQESGIGYNDLTIPPLGEDNPSYAHKQEEGLVMSGHIRTKEVCPKCGERFENVGWSLICKKCFTAPTRYYVDVYHKGKQRKIYSDNDGRILNNYELANRVLIEIRQKIQKHRFDPADYVAKSYVALQFDSYVKGWLRRYEELCNRGEIAPATIDSFKSIANKYFIPFFKSTDIRDIKAGDIQDFHLSLPSSLSISHQKNIMSILRMVFMSAKKRQDIKEVPGFPTVKLNDPDTLWLDEATQEKIYSFIPAKHQPIFLFMFRQGVRPGEARAVHWEDVDWTNRTVTIHRTFSGKVLQRKTKTRKIRIIPIDNDVYSMLLKMRGISGFIFTFNGKPYTCHKTISVIWKEAMKAAGIEHVKLYAGTRHSFASQAGNNEVGIFHLQEFLGHTSSQTTKRYIHLNTKGLRSVLDRKKGKVIEIGKNEQTSPRD